MRALIADADEVRREALREELARHGHDVTVATSTQELLAGEHADPPPELVAVGWRVGDDPALELVQALRAQTPGDGPVVVVVGEAPEVDVVAALDAGANDVWGIAPADDLPRDVAIRLSLAAHYARLQAEHVRVGGEFALLRRALDLTGTGFILTDPRLEDGPIVYANESFLHMTGYALEEVLGRNCRFLQGPATEPEALDVLRDAVREARAVTVELRNYRKDGTPFHNEVHVSPVRDEHGEVVRFVGVQIDVTAYRDAGFHDHGAAYLAAAGPVIDATLDLRATLDSIARVSVPRLAEVCLVDVLGDEVVERLAVAAVDPLVERAVERLPEAYAARDDDPVVQAMRSGRPAVLDTEQAVKVLGPEGVRLERRRPRSAMVVPLKARGRALGALVLASLERERAFEAPDLGLAEDIGRRAALAIDNARLYESQRGVAQALQSSLLPSRLPDLEALEFAASYRPFGEGMEIGGDFYDAFPMLGGATVLVVGDVSGKGASAAALTGLARHTLRTAAGYEDRPSRVLEALNRALVLDRVGRGRYCTVALAVLEPGADGAGSVGVTVSRAGHPVPFVVRADGRVEPIGRPGTLLGYVQDPSLHDARASLGPGDALVLYTDGVSEALVSRRADGEEWVGELLEGAHELSADAIARKLEHAAVAAQGGAPRDDVAVAVARVRRAPAAA
ncbi:SpoIIE family protein phosphatase [Conexibacter sp. SYSU D00693]|uniref:SpoIIE family protein phosphatase n=1 Tax=Conexibacter sp. SYSU D00693 TaxID=2812560 RepID=UPI00196A6C0F|nr:SpoIIE family protein phosphatase [Conexibacter sp. SYSU D00693]